MLTSRARLASCALGLLLTAAHFQSPTAPPPKEAVLEIALDSVTATASSDEVATAASTLRKAAGALDGLLWATDARFATQGGGRVLRARIWQSVEDAEAASLAFDGSEAEGAVAKFAGKVGRQTWHFRELRRHDYSDERAGHLEVVVFRTKAGTTREQNIERFDAGEAEFAKGNGLLGHSLWLAPDGRWVHLLRWQSAEAYQQTGKALFKTKTVGEWIRSLDFRRFTVLRGDTL